MEITGFLLDIIAWAVPVVLAITLHEAAHGFVAERFGDSTARWMGRVTINPIKHIDPVGTLLMPGLLWLAQSPVLFGYAKPVPVNFNNLRPLRLGMFAVAIAGPGVNIVLALLCGALLHLVQMETMWVYDMLVRGVIVNCALAVFNMLPILPLDGGRCLRAVLPGEVGDKFARTEKFGMLAVLALLLLPPLLGIDAVMDGFGFVVQQVVEIIVVLTGHSTEVG